MKNANKKMSLGSAWNLVVELLARRNHTEKELRQKLAGRGYTSEIAGEVVDRCRRRGYLDDAETGRLYADELIRKGYGPGKIRHFMIGKGIDGAVMDEIFREKAIEENQIEIARGVLEKKISELSRNRPMREVDRKAKLYRFMIYRGFSPEVIRELLEAQ